MTFQSEKKRQGIERQRNGSLDEIGVQLGGELAVRELDKKLVKWCIYRRPGPISQI